MGSELEAKMESRFHSILVGCWCGEIWRVRYSYLVKAMSDGDAKAL